MLLLLSCLPHPPPTSAVGPPIEAGSLVLVWSNAELRLGSSAFQAATWTDRAAHPGEVFLAAAVGWEGERLVVETNTHDPDNRSLWCVDGPVEDAWRLRFSVAQEDLAPAVARTWSQDFADGSAVTLAPGVPVVEGGVVVSELLLGVHPSETARIWMPAPDWPSYGLSKALRSSANPQVNGAEVLPLHPDLPWFLEAGEQRDDGRTVVRWDSGCGSFTGLVASEALSPPDEGGMVGILGMLGEGGTKVELAAGTPVTWMDGSPAGVLARERRFPVEDWSVRGERACMELPFGANWRSEEEGSVRTATVCIPASSGVEVQVPSLEDLLGPLESQ